MKNKTAHIALGTNLGNKIKNLEIALEEISEFSTITKKSSIHETEPVGYANQENFLNMCIEIQTDLEAIELLFRLQEIEHKMGRIRDPKNQNGPRIIDLDIILYEKNKKQEIIKTKHLQIPHPRMHKRSFVLDPLKELTTNTIHPILNIKIGDLQP